MATVVLAFGGKTKRQPRKAVVYAISVQITKSYPSAAQSTTLSALPTKSPFAKGGFRGNVKVLRSSHSRIGL